MNDDEMKKLVSQTVQKMKKHIIANARNAEEAEMMAKAMIEMFEYKLRDEAAKWREEDNKDSDQDS